MTTLLRRFRKWRRQLNVTKVMWSGKLPGGMSRENVERLIYGDILR